MQYKRALFIRFGGMGDILLATPALRAVYAKYPGMEIDFIVGKGMAPSLTGHPCVRNVITFDKGGPDAEFQNFTKFLRQIALARYDLFINFHPSVKTILMSLASGARRHIVFKKHMEVRKDTGKIAHAVDDFTKELRALKIESVTDRHLDFYIPEAAHARVDELLQEIGVTSDQQLLVINPSASRSINRWPKERFREVAVYFAAQPNMRVIVTGAPSSEEVTLAEWIASVDDRIWSAAGKLSVKELGALFTRAQTFLTCDTGPMHIGAALDVPMVTLFGTSDPYRTGPLTPNATILRDDTLSCIPCRVRSCARGDVMCMQLVEVGTVIEAVKKRLELHRRSKQGIALPIVSS